MKYVSVAEMIAIEKESDAKGHSYAQMMEHAGRGLAKVIESSYRHIDQKSALGLVGSGNNGGDALVAFCYLQEWGWQTTAYIVRPRSADDPLVDRYLLAGGIFLEIENDTGYQKLLSALEMHALILDGILGTGIRLPLRDPIGEVLGLVRTHLQEMLCSPAVVAVDCPSGVDCDSGDAAPECIPAEITVTMAAVKQGLLKFPAFKLLGDLQTVGIGLPDGLSVSESIDREVVDFDWVRNVIPSRPLDSHKGTFGTVLAIGGSINYSGAILLAGKAAFRSGAGWVTLAVPEPLHAALAGHFIEATWLLLPHENGFISDQAAEIIIANLKKPTALLIGPGFGIQENSLGFISNLLLDKKKLPATVIDADGLNLLAKLNHWWKLLPPLSILTPHPGEMSNLTDLSKEEIQSNRVETAETFAQEWGHIVVLKGAFTVIAAPDGRTAIIPIATPALARAGTGDVLAGLIGGFRAQGIPAFESAAAAAWLHAQAGLHAADVLGNSATVLAGDVLTAVVDVMAKFKKL